MALVNFESFKERIAGERFSISSFPLPSARGRQRIQLNDERISRYHSEKIQEDNHHVILTDLDSTIRDARQRE